MHGTHGARVLVAAGEGQRVTNDARRSWLIVPATQRDLSEDAAKCGTDVIVLDLVELVAEARKADARSSVASAVDAVRSNGAEAFVQVDPEVAADLRACVSPGLSGVLLSRVESPRQVERVATLIAQLESERGVRENSVKIVAAVETAAGNHAAYDIVRASPRMVGLTLGRVDLIMDLRPEPSGEIHLMTYLMQRLIIIAGAAGVMPIGAWWRAPDRGLLATAENTYAAAKRGRAIGFKGAMCLRANQVEPLNRAYS